MPFRFRFLPTLTAIALIFAALIVLEAPGTKILTLFPLGYVGSNSGDAGNTNVFGIVRVRGDAAYPLATFAHERSHASYRLRHPFKSLTSQGKEFSEERAAAVEALVLVELGARASFDDACNGLALNAIGHPQYARNGLWPLEIGPHAGNRDSRNLVGARLLADRFKSRLPEARAWLEDHRAMLDQVAKRLSASMD